MTAAMVLILRRRVHEVRAVPLPRLAARRDGGPDPGQRLPALGDDGDGRRVPGRPVRRRCSRRRACGGRSCSSIGCSTLVFGGLRALRQHDLKLLLAFGTVSQLGLLMVLFGAGTPATTTAGWDLLVAHAAFKATLFMVVGIIDHQTGTRDIRTLPAAPRRLAWGWRSSPSSRSARWRAIPLAAGFVAKELAYESLGEPRSPAISPCSPSSWPDRCSPSPTPPGSTGGRSSRPQPALSGGRGSTASAPAPPSFAFVAPAAVLAVVGVVLGVVPGLADPLATASLAGFGPATAPVHLVAVARLRRAARAVGAHARAAARLVGLGDRWLQPLLARGATVPSGAEIYLGDAARPRRASPPVSPASSRTARCRCTSASSS